MSAIGTIHLGPTTQVPNCTGEEIEFVLQDLMGPSPFPANVTGTRRTGLTDGGVATLDLLFSTERKGEIARRAIALAIPGTYVENGRAEKDDARITVTITGANRFASIVRAFGYFDALAEKLSDEGFRRNLISEMTAERGV